MVYTRLFLHAAPRPHGCAQAAGYRERFMPLFERAMVCANAAPAPTPCMCISTATVAAPPPQASIEQRQRGSHPTTDEPVTHAVVIQDAVPHIQRVLSADRPRLDAGDQYLRRLKASGDPSPSDLDYAAFLRAWVGIKT